MRKIQEVKAGFLSVLCLSHLSQKQNFENAIDSSERQKNAVEYNIFWLDRPIFYLSHPELVERFGLDLTYKIFQAEALAEDTFPVLFCSIASLNWAILGYPASWTGLTITRALA